MKKTLIFLYTTVFLVYALVLFPVCVLVYETASFSYREIVAMFVIPFFAGIILAYPFNQWAQKVHPSDKLFLFNAPILSPLLFFWVFLVFGNMNHYNRYLVLLKQDEPQLIIDNQSLASNAYGFVKFENIELKPELQNAFVYDRPNNSSLSYSYNRSRKVRYVVSPIQFRNQPERSVQYWLANSFYDLETVNYEISEKEGSQLIAYIIRRAKDNEYYEKALAEGLKTKSVTVTTTPYFLDYVFDFETHKQENQKNFFMYYGFYFLLMVFVWVVSLKYVKRGLGYKK